MTIKELCTKVREAAERARPIWMWRERGGNGRWHYTDVPPDASDRHWNETHELQPAGVSKEDALALLGRIEELEKALEPFAALGIEDSIFNPIAPLQADKARAALSGDTP